MLQAPRAGGSVTLGSSPLSPHCPHWLRTTCWKRVTTDPGVGRSLKATSPTTEARVCCCAPKSVASPISLGEDLVARLGLQWAEQVRELCVVLT